MLYQLSLSRLKEVEQVPSRTDATESALHCGKGIAEWVPQSPFLLKVVRRTGLEPVTSALSGLRSTN